MKEEFRIWRRMAKDDLNSAESNLKNRKYYVCAYLSHQAAEKALKALLLKKTKSIIKTHDLVILGKQINLPTELLKKCEQLSRVYIETKYGLGVYAPSQKFKKQNSSEYLKIAKEIVIWAEKNI
ncbi:HEPN domain-containing protein [Candidatus Woesearchaeota archaeon]|nr:HEPN domain-containing protein [Candidatus Woesearchaeota archaeon]